MITDNDERDVAYRWAVDAVNREKLTIIWRVWAFFRKWLGVGGYSPIVTIASCVQKPFFDDKYHASIFINKQKWISERGFDDIDSALTLARIIRKDISNAMSENGWYPDC